MKKIILHIGMPKTGTTSLQSFCLRNKNNLLDKGVLYPSAGLKGVGHHNLAWSVGSTGPVIDSKALFRRLCKEIDESVCDSVLISSEVFFIGCDVELLASYLVDYDVQIVCYLRRQDIWFQAMYVQLIKNNEHRVTEPIHIEKEMEIIKQHLDYYYVIENWAKCFGKESITVRSYDNKAIKKNIVSDFFDVIDLVREGGWKYEQNIGEKNISLPAEFLKVVQTSNKLNYTDNVRSSWLFSMQNASVKNNMSSVYQVISRADATNLQKKYAESNEKLAEFSGFETFVQSDCLECREEPSTSVGDEHIYEDYLLNETDLSKIVASMWAYYDEQIGHHEQLLHLTEVFKH